MYECDLCHLDAKYLERCIRCGTDRTWRCEEHHCPPLLCSKCYAVKGGKRKADSIVSKGDHNLLFLMEKAKSIIGILSRLANRAEKANEGAEYKTYDGGQADAFRDSANLVHQLLIDGAELGDDTTRSIRYLQATLPWGAHNYSEIFQGYTAPHRDFSHAFLHVQKAMGKLAIALDEADHSKPDGYFDEDQIDKYLADIIICALRMANTCPGRVVDLEAALAKRWAQKFGDKT